MAIAEERVLSNFRKKACAERMLRAGPQRGFTFVTGFGEVMIAGQAGAALKHFGALQSLNNEED